MNLINEIPHSFETRALLVRRFRRTDEADLYQSALSSVTEMFEFLPWCHPDYSIEETRAWLTKTESDWRAGNAYHFGIFSRDGKLFHGGCGLECRPDHPTANLGYWIKTTSTGQGIAAEAALGLATFGLEALELERIEIIMSTSNEKSRRVAEKTGARFEGTLRNRLRLHQKLHDAHVYSIIPSDLA